MFLSPPAILDQIEALQLEALESCSHDTKKLLLEIAIEKTQLLKKNHLNPHALNNTPTTDATAGPHHPITPSEPSSAISFESIPAFLRTPKSCPVPEAISFRIQLARERLDLTEADLARLLNTYSDHISDWECGTTEPPASMIIPLANALKCDPLWLLTGNIEVAQES